MKITIHGTGYVGLVTGACLADIGHEILCFDINSKKIDQLKAGHVPIFEPGLENLINDNVQKGNLRFSSDLDTSIDSSEVHFIAVGTPSEEDGSADLNSVLSVANSIASKMDSYKLIVTKSTVPVGSSKKISEEIVRILDERKENIDFDIASNPEFLKEGNAINDFMKPERIVIGTENPKTESLLKQIYAPFVKRSLRIISTSIESAELAKYGANAMLATRISFMNELSRLSERVGADIEEVRQIIGYDSRIGNSFLYAGIGFGGSCFPKDLTALNKIAQDNGLDLKILDSVIEVNESQVEFFIQKINSRYSGNLDKKTFAVWGLSFKPQTDDIRESPSIKLIQSLLSAGSEVQAYDPVVKGNSLNLGSNFKFYESQYEALIDADALIVATEWKAFWQPDLKKVLSKMKGKTIFDGRNIYDKSVLADAGIEYFGIGKR